MIRTVSPKTRSISLPIVFSSPTSPGISRQLSTITSRGRSAKRPAMDRGRINAPSTNPDREKVSDAVFYTFLSNFDKVINTISVQSITMG